MKIDIEKTKMNLRKVLKCEEEVEETIEKIIDYEFDPTRWPPLILPVKQEGKIDITTLDRHIVYIK